MPVLLARCFFLDEFEKTQMFNFPILFQYLFLSITCHFYGLSLLETKLENIYSRFVAVCTMKRNGVVQMDSNANSK